MQADAERTLSNLYILAALSHNDKLMTNEDSFDIYSPTSLRGLLRMWYGERRSQNVERVRQTIRAGIRYATQSLEDANTLRVTPNLRFQYDTILLQHLRMLGALKASRLGLENLVQTYRDDAALKAQLQMIVSEADDYIRVLQVHSDRDRDASPLPLHCVSDVG